MQTMQAKGVLAMTDQDNLRDRIEDALRDGVGLSWQNKAQAIIESLGLSAYTCCDECTSVTIEGYYDTAFDEEKQ